MDGAAGYLPQFKPPDGYTVIQYGGLVFFRRPYPSARTIRHREQLPLREKQLPCIHGSGHARCLQKAADRETEDTTAKNLNAENKIQADHTTEINSMSDNQAKDNGDPVTTDLLAAGLFHITICPVNEAPRCV